MLERSKRVGWLRGVLAVLVMSTVPACGNGAGSGDPDAGIPTNGGGAQGGSNANGGNAAGSGGNAAGSGGSAAGASSDADASTDELMCGEYVRVDSEDRTDIPEYVRNRDFEAEAARDWACLSEVPGGADADPAEVSDSLLELGCEDDFLQLASHTAAGISVKTIVDRAAPLVDGEFPIHFINSNRYGIHYDFASEQLSVGPNAELPVVGSLAEFNATEYSTPTRRFLLGALTYYPGTEKWVYELAQNDTATAEMITAAFDLVAKHSWIGGELELHTTSEQIATAAQELPADIKAVPTAEVVGGGSFQALNIAESYGRLRFVTAEELEADTQYLDFRDIVVLPFVPNDISVTVGIITSEFQTPLAHINVLSQNRGIPNMALAGAYDDPALRELEGEWVRLKVLATDYELELATEEEADTWWDEHRPTAVQVPRVDRDTTGIPVVDDIVDLENDSVYDAVRNATITYGGKAAHYGALRHIEGLPVPPGFAIPVHYYFQFMEQNGFDEQVDALLADPEFEADPAVRDVQLEALRDAMEDAEVDADFMAELREKLNATFPGERIRFRSSTNAEDLDGFTGAGLYTSKSGDENPELTAEEAERTFDEAIKDVWASVWFFRAFEERRYRSIDHKEVGMAILVHRTYVDEAAGGTALTNNPFDKSGAYPAFFVNTQLGEESVVLPPPGQTVDSYLHFWDTQGQRVQYLSYSNLVPEDRTVLTTRQIRDLGDALDKIHTFFGPAYSNGTNWWSMEVDFKFDAEPGQCPQLYIKQARPFGNR